MHTQILKNIITTMSIMMSLFVTIAQADVRIDAQLKVNHWDSNHQESVIDVNFDNIWIPENHYAGITTFYNETGYNLNTRIVSISDTTVTMELTVEDMKRDVIFNQCFTCTWDTSTSLKAGIKGDNEANLVSLTVLASKVHDATSEEIALCSTKLALAYALRNTLVTLPPIPLLIAAGITSNMVYQALSGSSETVACGASLIAALLAMPVTAIAASTPADWLNNKYEKWFNTYSYKLIQEEARIKSLGYEAYTSCGIVVSLLAYLVMTAK